MFASAVDGVRMREGRLRLDAAPPLRPLPLALPESADSWPVGLSGSMAGEAMRCEGEESVCRRRRSEGAGGLLCCGVGDGSGLAVAAMSQRDEAGRGQRGGAMHRP